MTAKRLNCVLQHSWILKIFQKPVTSQAKSDSIGMNSAEPANG